MSFISSLAHIAPIAPIAGAPVTGATSTAAGSTSFSSILQGAIQSVQGEVVEIDGRRLDNGRSVVSIVISDDGKHSLEGVWFNQPFVHLRFRYG